MKAGEFIIAAAVLAGSIYMVCLAEAAYYSVRTMHHEHPDPAQVKPVYRNT